MQNNSDYIKLVQVARFSQQTRRAMLEDKTPDVARVNVLKEWCAATSSAVDRIATKPERRIGPRHAATRVEAIASRLEAIAIDRCQDFRHTLEGFLHKSERRTCY